MKGKRYTEQQILDILGQLEAGTAISDLTRLHGVAMTTIYRWKARYGGMSKDEKEEIPPAGRRKSPPEEARR